uniref:GLUG motif-containing protein n=1 Tax=uncultured Parabacteroides sp. TaxID=512312 RepID=UPI0025990BF2
MVDPVSIGANSTGTLIGAVLGTSGEKETPTYLNNCRVRRTSATASEVYGINFVGGLVGGVDAQAVLVMHRCVNEGLPVGNRSDGSFVGGLVGGGTVNATAIMDSCVNLTLVSAAGSRCAGGLIGGIETANISNCMNKGNVSATHPSALGTGGIAGGLGTSTLAVVQNEGRISGYEGTGGIVGSTVISKSDGSYNDLIVASAHNYGAVYGTDNSGGIAGEAQAMLTDCYNRASVEATNTFAGGLAGYTPTIVVNNSYNNGSVDAKNFSGGLLGRASYYILTNSSNLAPVTASGGMAAGILALGGTTGMINFCTNYAPVRGTDLTAGIIAHAGETRSFTNSDIASVVISSGKTKFKLMKALKTPPKEMSSMKALFKGAKKVVKIAASTIELIDAIATPPLMQDISMWDELYNQKLDVRNEEMIARMNSEVFSSLPAYYGPLAGSGVLPGLVYDNSQAFTRSLEGDGDDLYADAVHERLGDISEQVAKIEQNREIALAVVGCILAVAGAVVSGGAATASVVICSAAVTTVGNLTERMDNCIEISQCSNFGTISAGKNGYGIIAFQGDHLKLHNCFSAGAASGYGVGDTALDGLDDVKPRRIISIGTINQDPFKSGSAVANQGLFFLVDGSGKSKSGGCTAEELALKSTYTDTQSPFDFDDNKTWSFQTPIVPLPYNNLYFGFR